jgi:hypothetical protein
VPVRAARPRPRVSTRALRQGRRCGAFLVGDQGSASRAGRRANPSAIARTSSCCNARSSGRSGSRRSTRRCRWRFSVWRPRTNETATLRARTTANGARASSSSRGLAWRSRAKVSCTTRSSTTCGSLTRAATTRRISGVSARRSCCCWVSEVGRSSPVPQASWADREWATGHGAVA